jgi:hypothetical protein
VYVDRGIYNTPSIDVSNSDMRAESLNTTFLRKRVQGATPCYPLFPLI